LSFKSHLGDAFKTRRMDRKLTTGQLARLGQRTDRPYLMLRWMACVFERVERPDDALTPEAVEACAARLARERKLMVCLVLSRRLSVYLDGTGQVHQRLEANPDVPCEPFAVIGGKRVHFDISSGGVLRRIDEPGGSS
jgi:hypothetical protein